MSRGRFGEYGVRFVPEALIGALDELERAHEQAQSDPIFQAELAHLHATYTGRPSIMTDARTDISDSARTLVDRLRSVTKTPICVGLGVSTREQARDVASFADGVIVGSAFVKEILASSNEDEAAQRVKAKAEELAKGVREAR